MRVNLYTAATGINNKLDPARLQFDQEKGISDLEAAKDMLIDSSGGLATRRGILEVLDGDFISCYPCYDGVSFYAVENRVSDSAIHRVIPKADGTVQSSVLVTGLTRNAKASFCLVGELVYWMNNFQSGVLSADSNSSWPVSEWPRDTTAQFIPTPAGSFLDMLSGRFIIGKGKELIYTEFGLWGIVDAVRNWERLGSDIQMVYSVESGVFVSDSKAVYFIAGLDPPKWEAKEVLPYPAIPYCRHPHLVSPEKFSLKTTAPSALFGTKRGPVIGLPDGTCFNLIDSKVTLPQNCSSGSIMLVDETTIIQSGV